VHALVAGPGGGLLHQWGDPGLRFYPRSSIKLMQAASWLTPSLRGRWELSGEELALACASHCGEDYHVAKVSAWLDRLGLSEEHLECGAHAPYDEESSHALVRAGRQPSQLHNNCSGKHAGLLTACKDRKWDVGGYSKYDHPVQELLRETLGRFLELDVDGLQWGIDGCGIPTYSVPLEAMVRTAAGRGLGALGESVKELNQAIAAHPRFLGGTKSFCTQVAEHTGGQVLAKLCAEGVYGAWIPKLGVGLAMKCEDGNGRATEVAMASILRELGYPLDFFSPLVRRWTGEVVGQFSCG